MTSLSLSTNLISFMDGWPYTFHSYKFHRLFPLSQYDLPTHTPETLTFPKPVVTSRRPNIGTTARPSVISKTPEDKTIAPVPTPAPEKKESAAGKRMPARTISEEDLALNPEVDYTRSVNYRFPTA